MVKRTKAVARVTDQKQGWQPIVPVGLLPWHGVNWQPFRSDLKAVDDQEGLARLDELLPRLRDIGHFVYTAVVDGREIETHVSCLTASHVLDWLRDRQSSKRLLAELAPALQMGRDSATESCLKWVALAAWVRRLSRVRDGSTWLGYWPGDDRDLGGVPSPFRTWATAFRGVTAKLLDHVDAPHDEAVQRLLLDLDEVLAGNLVDVTASLRQVEIVARVVRQRHEQRAAQADRRQQERGKAATRPGPEAIDATAKDLLVTALSAAKGAGASYLPSRTSIAASVSKALGHDISVQTLFGTKPIHDGTTVHRYPKFMALWNDTRKHSKDARRARVARKK